MCRAIRHWDYNKVHHRHDHRRRRHYHHHHRHRHRHHHSPDLFAPESEGLESVVGDVPSLTISMTSSGWNDSSSTSVASYGYRVLHWGRLGAGLGGRRGLPGAGGRRDCVFLLEVTLWILKRTNHKGIFEQSNTSSIKVHDGLLIGSYSLNTETNKSQRNIRAVEHLINQGAWWPSYWKLFSEYRNEQITKEYSSSRTPHQSRCMMAFLLIVILWILKRTNHKGIFERSNTSSIRVHDGLLIGSYSLNTETNKSQRNIRAVEHLINQGAWWPSYWKLFSEYWNEQITKEYSSGRTPHQSRCMMAFLLEVIL